MIITQSDRNFYNEHKDEYNHILSIVCPNEKELITPLHDNHIITKMWDIDKPLKNKFREYEPPNTLEINVPIMQIRNRWLDTFKTHEDFRLLIHCDAGVSRSPAMTLGLLWEMSSYIFKTELTAFEKDFTFKPYKGIGIPIFNEIGQILGIQVRLDEAKGSRYFWFSSGNLKDDEED